MAAQQSGQIIKYSNISQYWYIFRYQNEILPDNGFYFQFLLWFNRIMKLSIHWKKKLSGILCFYLKTDQSVIASRRGAILVPVIILTSVAILIITIAISMIPSHQKEALFLQQKLTSDILKIGLMQILEDPDNCICVLQGMTIDTTKTNQSLPPLSQIMQGGCGTGTPFIAGGTNIGYGVTVDEIEVNEVVEIGTDIYNGELVVSYRTGSLVRSVGEVKILLEISVGTAVPPNSRAISGCVAKAEPKKKQNTCGVGGLQEGRSHVNGKGYVSKTAKVAATAYVGPDARVCGNAVVSGKARIEDHAIIYDESVISGNAVVSGNAEILRGSKVSGKAKIFENARIYQSNVSGNAKISGGAKVQFSQVTDEGIVSGEQAEVYGATVMGRSTVVGFQVKIGPGAVINGTDPNGRVEVLDYSRVKRGASVTGKAVVSGRAVIDRGAVVSGNAKVSGTTRISRGAKVSQ